MPEDRRTPEEIRNGWSLEVFDAYHAKQAGYTQSALDWTGRPNRRPTVQAKWNPLRWGSRGLIERT
jgi:hypothetical protein